MMCAVMQDTYLGYWSGAEDYNTHDGFPQAYDFNDDVASPMKLRPAVEYNNSYSTFVFTQRAVDVIESAVTKPEQPMFLYLPYQNVHWPLEAPADYVAMYANSTGGSHQRNMICAMIKVLDDGVGNVTAALKRVGMLEKTVVIFSSDNGGPTNGNEGTWSSNFPLRGGKNTLWEGGTRVVGAIMGPGIAAGGVTYEKHHAADWLPTLVSMAAGKPWTSFVSASEPPYQLGDGLNNWALMTGAGASARDWLLYEAHPDGPPVTLATGGGGGAKLVEPLFSISPVGQPGLFARHCCFIGYWINVSKSHADLEGSTWRRIPGLAAAAGADSGNATLVSWESLNFPGDYLGLGGTATESGMSAEGGAQPIIVHKQPTSVPDKTACTFKLSEPDASGAVQMELLAAPG
eukprot:SAG31_NODE_9131_length_1329_cov_0.760163_2_plen_402_part_01